MSEVTEVKRGRPPRKEAETSQRRRRGTLSLDRNLKLHIPEAAKDPNYVYRFINDRMGTDRVRKLTMEDDYDIVHTHELLGGYGDEPPAEGQEGTPIRRQVGSSDGKPTYAYLVRKPKQYYDADKAEEQKLIDSQEKERLSGQRTGANELTPADRAYTPGQQ